MKKKVLIYGAGRNCKLFLRFIHDFDFEIVGVLDTYKRGVTFQGYLVSSPDEIQNFVYDEIFVLAAIYENEIIDMLEKKYKVDRSKIRTISYVNEQHMLGSLNNIDIVFITDDTDYLNVSYEGLKDYADVLMTTLLVQNKEMKITKRNDEFKGYIIIRSHCFEVVDFQIEAIRYKYPKAKIILLLSDMIDGSCGYLKRIKNFSVSYIKQRYDYIITYNYEEAEKYQIQFYELPYTKLNLKDSGRTEYDLFFVGNAKNRLDNLHQLYLKATKFGLKCGFWINNVYEADKLPDTDIVYNESFSYMQYLTLMMKSRCIVDLCQKNDKTTLRYSEAVVYNKKLLTDDKTCIYKTLYNSRFIKILPPIISEDLFKWVQQEEMIDYGYIDEFSPIRFVEYIKKLE